MDALRRSAGPKVIAVRFAGRAGGTFVSVRASPYGSPFVEGLCRVRVEVPGGRTNMLRVLVVYGSRSGQTAAAAVAIAVALADRGIVADVRSAESCPEVAGHDAVVVGSGVHDGRWLSAPTWFVRSNAERLRRLPVWFFSCLGSPDDVAPEPPGLAPANDADELGRLVHVKHHATFGGRPHHRGARGLFDRVMRGSRGERCEEPAAAAWADRIADLLASRRAHPSLAPHDAPNIGR
jgi:menaquinone-dependent protoporphyrinogen oxidase